MGLFILLFIVVFCLYQEYITTFIFLDNSNYPPSKIIYICETTDNILKSITIFEHETGISFSKKYLSVMIKQGGL